MRESVENNANGNAESAGTPVRVPDHVVFRAFPGETVALNLQTGKYHGLNPVAGRMVEALIDSGDLQATAALLAKEYDQPPETVEADLRNLCEDLARRGLIELPAHRAG
jgi:Coenzyme PQQ synthesis protein D (PqqD)